MKGLWKFFERVRKNEGNHYQQENLIIIGIWESLFVTVFSIVMIAFPKCRVILKWIIYIAVFFLGMGACGTLFEYIYALRDSYKFDKTLEATGRSRTDVIFSDAKLAEMKESKNI